MPTNQNLMHYVVMLVTLFYHIILESPVHTVEPLDILRPDI